MKTQQSHRGNLQNKTENQFHQKKPPSPSLSVLWSVFWERVLPGLTECKNHTRSLGKSLSSHCWTFSASLALHPCASSRQAEQHQPQLGLVPCRWRRRRPGQRCLCPQRTLPRDVLAHPSPAGRDSDWDGSAAPAATFTEQSPGQQPARCEDCEQ